eukprot:SAG25_NODE_295_length_10249_cov_5.144926_11_plen_197_part_00
MVRVRRGDTLGGGGMASSRPRAIHDRIASPLQIILSPLQITLSYLQHPQPVPSLAAFSTSRLTSWVLGCVELCATSMLRRIAQGGGGHGGSAPSVDNPDSGAQILPGPDISHHITILHIGMTNYIISYHIANNITHWHDELYYIVSSVINVSFKCIHCHSCIHDIMPYRTASACGWRQTRVPAASHPCSRRMMIKH